MHEFAITEQWLLHVPDCFCVHVIYRDIWVENFYSDTFNVNTVSDHPQISEQICFTCFMCSINILMSFGQN